MDQTARVLDDVSDAIADVYREHYVLERTVVKSYLVDDLLVCVLEEVGTAEEQATMDRDEILERRQSFQRRHEPAFCEAVERLTGRSVKTFLSANHVADRIAAEVFFLEPAAGT
jgi:uncharacterized protein YbcI